LVDVALEDVGEVGVGEIWNFELFASLLDDFA